MPASRRRAGPLVLGLLCLGAIGVAAFFAFRRSAASLAVAPAIPQIDDDGVPVEVKHGLTRTPGRVEPPENSAHDRPSRNAPADESIASPEGENEGGGETVLILEGVIRSTAGPGVEGAEVRFDPALALTDSSGSFELEVPYVVDETPVIATKPGYEPAVIPGFGATVKARTGSLEPVEVVLGSSPGDLTGRLVSTQGRPCPAWEIALYDASPVDPNALAGPSAEDLAAGPSNRQRTAADGSFRMAGLRSDRNYRLRAWNQGHAAELRQ